MKVLLAFILTIIAFGSSAETWVYQSSRLRSLVGGDYIDFVKHNNKIYYGMNYNYRASGSGGKFWVQSSNTITSSLSSAFNPIPKANLAQYLDLWGQPMDYVRTLGLESYGGQCHALLHVGAQYGGSGYYYVPAYATSPDCVNWTYHGPVSIEGEQARYIFSSSSAYFIENGVHYMAQDQGSYGRGQLVIWSSTDGMNYEQYSGDVNLIAADRPVFPDMDSCDGIYHMLYENGWDTTYPFDDAIRHIISYNLLDWEMHDATAGTNYKGMNISCIDNDLYGISRRNLFKWQ